MGRSLEGRFVEGRFVERTFLMQGRFVEGRFVGVPVKIYISEKAILCLAASEVGQL